MNVLTCSDEITLDASGNPECVSGWTQQIHVLPFDTSQITPELVMSVFGAGFTLFAIPYLTTIGARWMLSLLKN